MSSRFESEYSKLNDEQRTAVDYIDGPLLVVAGPGTGKTQLLSLRVTNILKKTDAGPSNILCLTYTNKAAINMKQRIIQLAGGESSRLPVKTFHSFAGEIMNLYPDYFWNSARLTVAPDSVQIEIIESIISGLDFEHPLALKFAGQFTLINEIRQAIGLAKDAGLTPDKLRAIIEVNLAYINVVEAKLVDILPDRLAFKNLGDLQSAVADIPDQPINQYIYPLTSLSSLIKEELDYSINLDLETGKTTHTGAWKRRWIQLEAGEKGMFAERRRNIWWQRLADIYSSYLEKMHERGFYDYSDMLVEVITKLEQNPDLLADLQEKYSYVLIDEFQDTTLAQLRLAHLVADHHSANNKPNLMVVGDDDQTIFKFSGAELNNMLGFKRRYPDTKIVVLTKNYRSTQAVLDIAHKVIEQANSRLVNQDKSLDKNLIAMTKPKLGSIQAISFSSKELQYSQIARSIQASYASNKQQVVLARSHDSLIKIANILNGLNVPISYEYQSNVLDNEIVNQIYIISKLILAIQNGDKEQCNSLIHQLIRHPMWGISPQKLWLLAQTNFKHNDWLGSLSNDSDKNISSIGNWFLWLASETSRQPLAVTIEYLLGLRRNDDFVSPINNYFVGKDNELTTKYFQSLSAIQLLRSLAHEFTKNDQPNLYDLVQYIEINKTNGLAIADKSPFVTGDNAVQLMTVYKAKGLEFDEVYVIDAVEDVWQPRSGKRQPPANLPLQPAGDDLDDYVRLMYVALTRAKSAITVSSYYQNHAGKDVATSPIIQSAFEITRSDSTNQDQLTVVLVENLKWPDLETTDAKSILKARLETYSLSVTHLLNFLNIEQGGPQYFKERNLLRLPEAKSATLGYGSAMHEAMETAQNLVNRKQFSIEKLIEDYSRALTSQQLDKNDFDRYRSRGEKVLNKLFDTYKYALPVGSKAEQSLQAVALGDSTIGGKLDRIDFTDSGIKIIDYKTGNPLNSFETSAKSLQLKAHRHKMQLIFYDVLAKHHPNFANLARHGGQMVYLEAESANQLVKEYQASDAEVKRLEKLIQAVYSRIMALDFPDISKYSPDFEGTIAFEDDLIETYTK